MHHICKVLFKHAGLVKLTCRHVAPGDSREVRLKLNIAACAYPSLDMPPYFRIDGDPLDFRIIVLILSYLINFRFNSIFVP